MTQNFTVVETQTEKKGVRVALKDTVKDVRAILDGKVDILQPEDLSFIGTLTDVEEKIKTKQNIATGLNNQPTNQPPVTPNATQPEQNTTTQNQQNHP